MRICLSVDVILIESSINTNEMYSRVNENLIYITDITFGITESILSGNEQQKVYLWGFHKNRMHMNFFWRTHIGLEQL